MFGASFTPHLWSTWLAQDEAPEPRGSLEEIFIPKTLKLEELGSGRRWKVSSIQRRNTGWKGKITVKFQMLVGWEQKPISKWVWNNENTIVPGMNHPKEGILMRDRLGNQAGV